MISLCIFLAWAFLCYLCVNKKHRQCLKMQKPYSEDLRWRIIYERFFCKKSYSKIAAGLFVSRKTLMRMVRTFIDIGDVKPCRLGCSTGKTTLFPHEEFIIMDCLLSMPQIKLHEIANYIFNTTSLINYNSNYMSHKFLLFFCFISIDNYLIQITFTDCKQYMQRAGYI